MRRVTSSPQYRGISSNWLVMDNNNVRRTWRLGECYRTRTEKFTRSTEIQTSRDICFLEVWPWLWLHDIEVFSEISVPSDTYRVSQVMKKLLCFQVEWKTGRELQTTNTSRWFWLITPGYRCRAHNRAPQVRYVLREETKANTERLGRSSNSYLSGCPW